MHLTNREKLFLKGLGVMAIIGIGSYLSYLHTEKVRDREMIKEIEFIMKDSKNQIAESNSAIKPLIKKDGAIVGQIQGTYHVNKSFDLVPNDPKGDKKVVLITIDDGPSKYAESMMNTLDKHNAKAIFFINGIHVKNELKDVLKTEIDRGFAVGNHTWSHPYLKRISFEAAKSEVDKNSKLIEGSTGEAPKFFRAPFGESTQEERDYIKGKGMIYMNWSGSVKDWEAKSKNKDVFMNNVMKDLHPGEIILIHEHKETDMYLDELLTKIEEKGYTILDPKNITN